MDNITLMPSNEDLASTVIAMAIAYLTKQSSPSAAGLEQMGAIILGRNLANNTAFANPSNTTNFYGSTMREHDAFTAGLRGGYSAYSKRSSKTIAMDTVKGAACNIMGRMAIEKMA